AKPRIPVEADWRWDGGDRTAGWVLVDPRFDAPDRADAAVAHQVARGPEHAAVVTALLVAGLKYRVGLILNGGNRVSLSDCERKRLFAINVLLLFHRVDGAQRVPVVRSGDEDDIHIFVVVEFSKIEIRLHGLADGRQRRHALRQVAIIHVAHSGE